MNEELTEALTEVQEHLGNPQDTQEKPAKITFDEAQQKRVDELIRRAQGRAARELREHNEQLKTELEALRGQQGQQAVPNDVLTELSTTRAELQAMRQKETESQIMSEVRKVTGGFVDQELAAQLIRQGIRQVEGKLVPVDADGNPRLNSDFEPMSLEDAARDLARQKPFLARGDVRLFGAGSTEAARSTLGDVPRARLAQLFGPNSDAAAANRLALKDARAYSRYKEAARKEGLIR
jgi:hypothetical protein